MQLSVLDPFSRVEKTSRKRDGAVTEERLERDSGQDNVRMPGRGGHGRRCWVKEVGHAAGPMLPLIDHVPRFKIEKKT